MDLKKIKIIKSVLFIACLIPLALLIWNALNDNLGANPIEVITHNTGDWTLRFLMITLAVTPLRYIFKQPWLIRLRRMFGLYAFFYVCLHLITYLLFDHFFVWEEILLDIYDRPFITVGMTAFVLLLPLAITSTNKAIKRLGPTWKRLHRLVYVIAGLGVLHFIWLVKKDLQEPLIYLYILTALLGYRVYRWSKQRYFQRPAQVHH